MWFSVGIDLGTSFACAAVGGPGGTRMIPLSPNVVVPSVACPGPDGTLLTGLEALTAARDPSMLARGFKRRLGDPSRLVLGSSSYTPTALMAAQLRDALRTVQRVQGGLPSSVVLTYPAIWGPYRREQFAEVPRMAGVTNYRLATEPEAAATHYSNERRLGEGAVVAVYDLGGGTFDTTVLRVRGGRMEILGTPEGIEHMGGVDFDETLLANVDERLDGAISALDLEDPEQASALARIRAMCIKAKEDLSIEPDVTLSVPLPSGPREVTISRLEFNEMIRPSVQMTADTLRRTVAGAGLQPNDLAAILLAGGSSRIPLVSQLISKEFGRPVRLSLHPKFTVALGAAAIAAQQQVEPQPPVSSGPIPVLPSPAPAPQAPAQPLATGTYPALGVAALHQAGKSPKARFARNRKTRMALAAAAVAAVVGVGSAVLVAVTRSQEPGYAAAGAYGTALSVGASSVTPSTETPMSGASQAPSSGPSKASEAPGTAEAQVPQAKATSKAKPPATNGSAPRPMVVFDGTAVAPWEGYIGSADSSWSGTDLVSGTVRDGAITARIDQHGVRATWNGRGAAQVYFQSSPDLSKARDLTRFFDSDGAIVFDVVVHRPPTRETTLEVHCGYPCRTMVSIDGVLKRLEQGRQTRLTVPLACFNRNKAYQLNQERVNTAWLVYTEGELSATFSNIRWVAKAGAGKDAISCDELG